MQNKYGKTGKFTVFFSNVQMNDASTKEFLESKGVNFPVYHQVRLPHAPCGRGIPHAVLFDHTGKVVQTGHPSKLYPLVEDLVKKVTRNPPASRILGGLKIEHCEAQAKALTSGGIIYWQLQALDKFAERDDAKGQEAKKLAAAVRTFVAEEVRRLKDLAKEQPGNTAFQLEPLVKQLQKMEEHADMAALYKSLVADADVKAMVKIRKDIAKLDAKIAKSGDSKSTASAQKRIKARLEKLGAGDSPVAKEARELAKAM